WSARRAAPLVTSESVDWCPLWNPPHRRDHGLQLVDPIEQIQHEPDGRVVQRQGAVQALDPGHDVRRTRPEPPPPGAAPVRLEQAEPHVALDELGVQAGLRGETFETQPYGSAQRVGRPLDPPRLGSNVDTAASSDSSSRSRGLGASGTMTRTSA